MSNEALDNTPDEIKEIWEQQERRRGKYWSVCHTPGCFNEYIPIVSLVNYIPPILYCGCCNALLDDLTYIEG